MRTLMRQGVRLILFCVLAGIVPVRFQGQDAPETTRKVTLKTQPQYPALARTMHITGVVKLEATVAPNGTVKSINVKGGHPVLTQSAVTAEGHWKFEAAPHETTELIEIRFEAE